MENDIQIKYMAGQYQSPSLARRYAIVSTTAMCIILEYFAVNNSLGDKYKQISHEQMLDMVFKQMSFKRNTKNESIVDTAILNMVFMGILRKEGLCYTTDEPFIEVYKSQVFQSQCANLYQAEASRKLANVAVCIAIASLIITAITAIISLLF